MRVQSHGNFWQRIHKSAKENGFPLRVMFELTYRCNFKCKHCYVPLSFKKRRELKTKEVFSVLEQLKDIGCFYLGFTGGEPFMRKDIIDILWHAKKKGFELIIYSNGSLINKEIAHELQQLRPNKVDITIPAISKFAFERITGMFDSHRKVFNAIDLLHKRGIRLGFKSCVLKENESEIKDIQDFAASLNAQHRLDNRLSMRLDGSREPYKYRGKLRAKGLSPKGTVPDCDIKGILPDNHNLFKCGVGESQAAITPQGELKMCLMIDYPKYKIVTRKTSHVKGLSPQIPNSLETKGTVPNSACSMYQVTRQAVNLEEAWEKLRELVAGINPDKDYKCHICELQPYCKWCPGKGWLYNRRFTACEPESKKWAKRCQKIFY